MLKGEKRYRTNIKEIVREFLKYKEKPTINDIVEIISPHYKFTKEALVQRELTKKARYIMRSFKDENGVGIYFSDDQGFYINVDKTDKVVDLYNVNRQLNKKYTGLSGTIKKVTNRLMNLAVKINAK